MIKTLLRALCAPLLLAAAGALAQAPNAQAEMAAAQEAADRTKVEGPARVALGEQATLKLPAGYVFVPREAAALVLKSMGNRVDDRLLGAVFPADDAGWLAVVRFIPEGYVRDDDARDWNADELLQSLREGTAASNEERARRGLPAIEVAGWAEKPRYDARAHQLVWSASTRRQGAAGDGSMGVNYNTYTLGREGYISLNLVTRLDLLEKHRPAALDLLAATEYNEGKRYADFNGATDKVAAYGLAALVAGAAAKKLGFFALVAAFVLKFGNVIVLALAALGWAAMKWLRRKPRAPRSRRGPEGPATVAAVDPLAAGEPRQTA